MSIYVPLAKVLAKLVEIDGLTSVLVDGKIPPEAKNKLDEELAELQASLDEISSDPGWIIDDYSVPVDVIVGESGIDRIEDTATKLSKLISEREAEVEELAGLLDEVGDKYAASLEADLALTDAIKVLEDTYEMGGAAVDMIGSSQLGMAIIELNEELENRTNNRTELLRKLRDRLAKRLEAMREHLDESRPAISELQEHFERLKRIEQNKGLMNKINDADNVSLQKVRAAADRIAAAEMAVKQGNERTRETVRRIISEQQAAAARAAKIQTVLAFVQIGLAAANIGADASAVDGADGSSSVLLSPPAKATGKTPLKTPVRRTTTPVRRKFVPHPPVKMKGPT
ncbi:MAG: hypothetical protein AAF293_00260 [Pseudomonadota bacterium]